MQFTRNILIMLFTSIVLDAISQQGINGTGYQSPAGIKVTVTTIAGRYDKKGELDGAGTDALFWNPGKICYDARNSCLYVADQVTIRRIDKDNNVTTYMDKDQLNRFDEIRDIDTAAGKAGTLYFTTKNNALFKIEPDGNRYKLIQLTKGSGNEDGPLSTNDHLDGTWGVASGRNGQVAIYNSYRCSLKKINMVMGIVNTWAGKPTDKSLGLSWPYKDGAGIAATFGSQIYDICSDGIGNIYIPDKHNALIRKIDPDGHVTSFLPYAPADGPYLTAHIQADGVGFIAANKDGSRIYFTAEIGTYGNSSPLLRLLQPGKPVVSIAGFHDGHKDGPGDEAQFGDISGLAVTPDGKTIFVAEGFNHVIRKIVIY